MIIDGHFHLHYSTSVQNSVILSQLSRVEKIRKKNSLDKILSVIPLENSEILDALKNYDYLYPGLYILIEDYNPELIEKIKKFNFIKIQHWLSMPYLLPEKLEKLFLDSISIGKKKFQIHTETIDEKRIKLIEKYIKDYDAKFYLTHGVYAVYSYSSKIKPSKLKRLEGNLFLGTSPFWGALAEIPSHNLIKAVKDGLENLIVFESDFVLNYEDELYDYTLESIRKSVGENEKILYENINKFLK